MNLSKFFTLICAVDDWMMTTISGLVTIEGCQLQLDLITILIPHLLRGLLHLIVISSLYSSIDIVYDE